MSPMSPRQLFWLGFVLGSVIFGSEAGYTVYRTSNLVDSMSRTIHERDLDLEVARTKIAAQERTLKTAQVVIDSFTPQGQQRQPAASEEGYTVLLTPAVPTQKADETAVAMFNLVYPGLGGALSKLDEHIQRQQHAGEVTRWVLRGHLNPIAQPSPDAAYCWLKPGETQPERCLRAESLQ